MPILNMVGGGKKGGNIGEPLDLTVVATLLDATITWTDNEIGTIPPTSFVKSELVRKVGSAPSSPSDGTLVVTETVKDTYKNIGYVDSGLTSGTTYYYRVFSYSDLGGISYCDAVSVTPSSSRLPTTHQEVEWIDSSNGGCCIETGVAPSSTITIELDITPNMSYTSEYSVLGNYWSGNAIFLLMYQGKYRIHNGGSFGDGPTITGSKTNLKIDNLGLYVDGVLTPMASQGTYGTGNINLFMITAPSGFETKAGRYTLYETYIKDSGTLIRDFVPCYRIADGEIGMYDIVNDVFYTNTGGGTLTKGPDVN